MFPKADLLLVFSLTGDASAFLLALASFIRVGGLVNGFGLTAFAALRLLRLLVVMPLLSVGTVAAAVDVLCLL